MSPSSVEQGADFVVQGNTSLDTVLVTIYQGTKSNLGDKKYQVAVEVNNGKYTTGTITVPAGKTEWPVGKYTAFAGNGDNVAVTTFNVIEKKTDSGSSSGSSGSSGFVGESTNNNKSDIDAAINSGASALELKLSNGAKVYAPTSELVKQNATSVAAGVVQVGEDDYNVDVMINQKEVEDFEDPITVKLPLVPSANIDSRLIVVESDGEILPLSLYDAENKELVFKANDTTKSFKISTVDVGFNDIADVEWAHEAILNFAAKGIINGVADRIYEPNRDVTRAEFVKILVGALGIPATEKVSSFSDVEADAWYAPYIAAAKAVGITKGYDDGTFGVYKTISRQEMVTMLNRAMVNVAKLDVNYVRAAITFSDDADIADYARESVYAMYRAGIINGMGDNVFAPVANTTRAQAAKAIYEVYKLLVLKID